MTPSQRIARSTWMATSRKRSAEGGISERYRTSRELKTELPIAFRFLLNGGIQAIFILCAFSSLYLFAEVKQAMTIATIRGEDISVNSPHTALFFNIYIPSGEKQSRALEITRSQMDYINASTLNITRVLCNVITETESSVPGCDDMANCFVLKRVESGAETLTLLDVYNYCLNYVSATVIYIHNKGSYHDMPENTHLREMHMKAQVRTSMCLKSVASGICDVCSARFSPLPHFHTGGNMWTAHCSYVKNLISPIDFEGRMNDTMDSLKKNQTLFDEMFADKFFVNFFIGLERFSSEHWIHSHPNVVPCDVLPNNFAFVWGYDNIPEDSNKWEPELHVGPRFPFDTYVRHLSRAVI